MKFWRSYLRKGAEFLTATMLAVMFATFILQIVSRYFFTPVGWTVELITVLWIWVIFIGNAFVVRNRDHVSFDIVYLWAPPTAQRIMAGVSAMVVAGVLLWSLPATLDYHEFLKIKKTPLLKISFKLLFSCYVIFVVAAIIYSILRVIEAWRNQLPESPNEAVLSQEGGEDAK